MEQSLSSESPTKAEIGFDSFPCGPCAEEADRVLTSLEEVLQTVVDPTVRRITVHFDPARVKLPLIVAALEPFGGKPRAISVVSPMKGVI